MKKAKLKSRNSKSSKLKEILDYDDIETTNLIDSRKPLSLSDLGLKLPAQKPTQVISIRLPSELINALRAIGSQNDIPYQALIKLSLSKSVAEWDKEFNE